MVKSDSKVTIQSLSRVNTYRTIFLSDWHMGARTFNGFDLLEFLKTHESEKLYLVGDIIDGWKLEHRWFWPEIYNSIIDELVRKRYEGTEIIFLPGNHDEKLRNVLSPARTEFANRFGMTIKDLAYHTTAAKQQLQIMHGDYLDRKIIRGALSRWSDAFYENILDMLGAHGKPYIKVKGKMKRFSLAKAVNGPGHWALYLINNFEAAIRKLLDEKKLGGIICGHTHIPTLKKIGNGIYANTGHWLRGQGAAVVEEYDGTLKLIKTTVGDDQNLFSFETFNFQGVLEKAQRAVKILPDAIKYRPETEKIVNMIRNTWVPKDNRGLKKPVEWIEVEHGDYVTVHALSGLLATKIRLKSDKSRERMVDSKNRDIFEIRTIPAFIGETPAE